MQEYSSYIVMVQSLLDEGSYLGHVLVKSIRKIALDEHSYIKIQKNSGAGTWTPDSYATYSTTQWDTTKYAITHFPAKDFEF